MFLRACLSCLLYFTAAFCSRAGELAELFPKLPASVFAKWAGEGAKPIADAANRIRLVAAGGDAGKSIAAELRLRDFALDERNGFLRFGSESDGEGTVFTMALWKCTDGSKLAGAAIEHWSNVTNETAHITFWRVRDGKLADVTAEMLPEVTLAKFYEGHADKVRTAAAEGFRWWWKLPQKGTTIRIEAPSLENLDDYAALAKPDHAYEGRWDGKAFRWVRVKGGR